MFSVAVIAADCASAESGPVTAAELPGACRDCSTAYPSTPSTGSAAWAQKRRTGDLTRSAPWAAETRGNAPWRRAASPEGTARRGAPGRRHERTMKRCTQLR